MREARAWLSAENGERIDAALPIARLIEERIEIDARLGSAGRDGQ
jgi:hypothetical protein